MIDKIPNYEVDIFWSEEDEAYVAIVPDLPYCSAWGETREEALAQVEDAIIGHLEVRRDTGRPIPEPRTHRKSETEEAAEKFANAIKESYQAVTERAVSAQELNVQLTQDFFNEVINNLQAENNRTLAQDLIEQQRKTSQALAQKSANAYMDFLNSMFSYYQGNLERTKK